MQTPEILYYKSQGLKADAIYQIAAGQLGLFGAAFYGHRCSRRERATLNRTWKRINQILTA